ncbi:MAG: helix-hairpin-helix domain-containing protein [Legionellaceae bacterium]|nr:helix-hairpin-helix domain-containing protein [Legionellaceae bacterium]
MKAILFAAVLSLSIVSLPSAATAASSKELHTPRLGQTVKQINLNTASIDVLTKSFKGIGKKRAEAIVSYRQNHGDFKSVSDLAAVRGLGKAFVTQHLAELEAVFITK